MNATVAVVRAVAAATPMVGAPGAATAGVVEPAVVALETDAKGVVIAAEATEVLDVPSLLFAVTVNV